MALGIFFCMFTNFPRENAMREREREKWEKSGAFEREKHTQN